MTSVFKLFSDFIKLIHHSHHFHDESVWMVLTKKGGSKKQLASAYGVLSHGEFLTSQ